MANFAVLNQSNIVVNIISADTLIVAEQLTQLKCIEYDDNIFVTLGWVYSEDTQEFVDPRFL
jgi:hypothetical protein